MKPCCRKGCTNPGAWYPVLQVTSDGEHYAFGPMPDLAVCDSCKASITLDDLIGDSGWKMIASAFLAIGRAEPRRELTKVEWEKIKDAWRNEIS